MSAVSDEPQTQRRLTTGFKFLSLRVAFCSALWLSGAGVQPSALAKDDVAAVQRQAGVWRAEHRIIDLHQHIDYTTQHLARAVKIMDAVGLGIGVNLSGGYVTRTNDEAPSAFERNKQLADRLFPGRFLHYMNLDYQDWDAPEVSARAVKQIEEGH